MALNSGIEWTESTWNPVTGCTKISRGCRNCYAERMSKRLAGRYGYPKTNPFQVVLHPNRLTQPSKWKGRHMIFVCSMSDLFHDEVPEVFIFKVLETINRSPEHTFQILTKREKRLLKISRKLGRWPENVWVGVTVEAREYKERIASLRDVNAAVRFLSCEPLLDDLGEIDLRGIDWVIVGGESGPNARPMRPEWAANLRNRCLKKNVPYFFKQWGGFNKKAAGRRLEGKEWNQMPQKLQKPDPSFLIQPQKGRALFSG